MSISSYKDIKCNKKKNTSLLTETKSCNNVQQYENAFELGCGPFSTPTDTNSQSALVCTRETYGHNWIKLYQVNTV